MKYMFTFTFLLTLCFTARAQQFNWVERQSSNGPDQTNGIATDAKGNVIAVGTFDGTASFGSLMLTTSGSLDIFVAKYDSTGTCLWAHKAGGQFGDEGRDVAVDEAGNIYVTGIYGQAGASFDGINVGTLGGLRNGFLAKYTPAGEVIWVKTMGGSNSGPEPRKIESGPNQQIFIAGDFYGTMAFGGQQQISSTQTGGMNDVFIARFDSSGAVQWARKGGDRKVEKVTGLAIDPDGNALLYGSFDSLTTFMSDTRYAQYGFTGTYAHYDMFLVKYSPAGDQLWLRTFGGGDEDVPGGICTDAAGYIYTTGFFRLDFISGPINIFGNGGFNLFIHKLNSAGTPLWMKFTNNTGSGSKTGLDMACSGNRLWLAGYFGAPFKTGNVSMTGQGENNPMLMKYDTSGTAEWGMSGSGTVGKVSQGLSLAISGNKYYYAGYITGTVTFSGTAAVAPGVYTDGFICAVKENLVATSVSDPATLQVNAATTTSVTLAWNGTSPEFRVLKKTGSSSTSATDGDVIYEGADKTFTLSGLSSNTPYFITVYGKAAGSAWYSDGNKKLAATTVSDNPGTDVITGFLAGETIDKTFGTTGVKISIRGASVSDGNIRVNVNTDLTATGTLPVNIDSIYKVLYWTITNSGLSGGSLRYCITLDVTRVWDLVQFLNYHILKRPGASDAWEDLMANSSYTVTFNSPEITVCGLSSFSEFAIGMSSLASGLSEKTVQTLQVFPNPSSGTVTLNLGIPGDHQVEVYDMQGKQVKGFYSSGPVITIEKGKLPGGIYFIRAGERTGKIWFKE